MICNPSSRLWNRASHSLDFSIDFEIPIDFIGLIEIKLFVNSTTFNPNTDPEDAFYSIKYYKSELLVTDQIPEEKTFTYSKDFNNNTVEFEFNINESSDSLNLTPIEFYNSLIDEWVSSYDWSSDGSLESINDRKARIMLSHMGSNSNGYEATLDNSRTEFSMINSLLYQGKYYQPYYIIFDKINDILKVKMLMLNNDTNEPNKQTSSRFI